MAPEPRASLQVLSQQFCRYESANREGEPIIAATSKDYSWSVKLERGLRIHTRVRNPSWHRDTVCICDMIDQEDLDNVHRKPNRSRKTFMAIKSCAQHDFCCAKCEPTCHGLPARVRVEAVEPPSKPAPRYLLENLHPVPLNLSSYDRRTVDKKDKQRLDKEAWQAHSDILRKLTSNPYEDCICDVVGLDDAFQILEYSQSDIGYLHRPDCLAHPNTELVSGAVHPDHTSQHAAYLSTIRHFRKTARSRTGRRKFTQKARYKLESQCGLHYRRRLTSNQPLCDCEQYNQPKDTCNKCGKCCPECSPSCHDQAYSDNGSDARSIASKVRTTELGTGSSQSRTGSWVLGPANVADCDCHLYESDDEDWKTLNPAMKDAGMRDCTSCGKCCPRCAPDCDNLALGKDQRCPVVDLPKAPVDSAHLAKKAEQNKMIRSRHSIKPPGEVPVRASGRSITPETPMAPHPATHGATSGSAKRKASSMLQQGGKRQRKASKKESPGTHHQPHITKVDHQKLPRSPPRTARKPNNEAAKPSSVSTRPRTPHDISSRCRGDASNPLRKPVTHPNPGTRTEPALEQEDWPTSYDSKSIASDILRAAGIHPTLPPLNAHLKPASEFEELAKIRKGKMSRKTA